MSKNMFLIFYMNYKGCDKITATTEWMRRLADPFNHPQEKGDDGEIEVAVKKYRYIDASSEKAQEAIVEAGYKDIKKPSSEDVDALVQDAQKRGLQFSNDFFSGSLNSSMAGSLPSAFGGAGGANNAVEETPEQVAKQAAEGRASLKDLLGNLQNIPSDYHHPSPQKPAAALPDALPPPAPEPFDAGWEISAAHNDASASVATLGKECDKAACL